MAQAAQADRAQRESQAKSRQQQQNGGGTSVFR
jgi:hypothetical protein